MFVALFGAMLGVFAHILTPKYYFKMNYAISTVLLSKETIDFIWS